MGKVALHIIAKDEFNEVENIVNLYERYFDSIDIAVDDDKAFREISNLNRPKLNVYKYEWDDEEKELGFPKFDKKRNFLADKCKCEWYFRLDTDDEIINAERIQTLIKKAEESKANIIACYYDYARGEGGITHASHYRETIIRNDGSSFWKKHIHENLIPKQGTPKTVMDKYSEEAISIKHHLDDEHVVKSRDRNLKFLISEYNKTKDNPDPRTLAYLGRMLYPMGRLQEAKYFLEQHIKTSGWDEDRCLSWCMLADIMLDLNKPDDAIACCYEAINDRHDFPDPYLKLHWIYFKLKNYAKAIHWGKLGLGTNRPETFMLQDPASTTWRPAITMAECYLMIGDVDNAIKFFTFAKKYVPDFEWIKNNEAVFYEAAEQKKYVENFVWFLKYLQEKDKNKIESLFETIPENLKKHEFLVKLRHQFTPPKTFGDKEIEIYCGQAWEDWSSPSVLKGIGGSEEAVIYVSRELTKLGYSVTVYNSCGDMDGFFEGVAYKPFYEFNPFDEHNIVIGWRGNIFKGMKAKKKIVWLHDVPIEGLLKLEDADDYDAIMVLSEYHKSLLPDYIPEQKIFVTRNGINEKDFRISKQPKRNRKRIIYTSSYDRGIQHLLEVWEDVLKEVPDAELHLFYGWNTYDSMMAKGHRPPEFKDYMCKLMQKPNVFEHGRIGHKKLIQEFYKSGIYAYPSHFQEISCISAMKAQACGCVPIVTDYAALKETVKAGIKIDGNTSDKEVVEKFKQELIKILKEDTRQEELRKEVFKHQHEFSWEGVAKQWHEELLYTGRNKYSDYEDYKKTYVTHGDFKTSNFDENGDTIIYDRYKYVLDGIKKYGIKSIIDNGASDGGMCFAINKKFGIPADGIEADKKCVEFANKYAEDNKLNCKFYNGLTEEVRLERKYDSASALEIIEHVIDPKKFLETIESNVEEGGYIFISTPHKDGYFGEKNFNPQHIHFFDEKSLEELIGKDRIVNMEVQAEIINLVYKK